MDIETIVRLLTNTGFNVRGVDASQTYLLLEDPSCIMRSFQTFLEYAWVFISLITAILLFGWGVSKIRGANTDIVTNIRNLLIMFGVLSATGPIVNLIYGGDLMARTCNVIQVPLADVQQILDARNAQLSADDHLFENLDIFDSGIRYTDADTSDTQSVDVPNISVNKDKTSGEITLIFDDDTDTVSDPATSQAGTRL